MLKNQKLTTISLSKMRLTNTETKKIILEKRKKLKYYLKSIKKNKENFKMIGILSYTIPENQSSNLPNNITIVKQLIEFISNQLGEIDFRCVEVALFYHFL